MVVSEKRQPSSTRDALHPARGRHPAAKRTHHHVACAVEGDVSIQLLHVVDNIRVCLERPFAVHVHPHECTSRQQQIVHRRWRKVLERDWLVGMFRRPTPHGKSLQWLREEDGVELESLRLHDCCSFTTNVLLG